MFSQARAFNGNISSWDISSIKNLAYMFYSASAYNQKLCWNIPTAAQTTKMFFDCAGSIGCPTRPPTPIPTRPPTPNPTRPPTHEVISLTKNHLYTTIKGYSTNYRLSLKLKPRSKVQYWTNIIRMTSTNLDMSGYGDRWLALWFSPNSYDLYVGAGTNYDANQLVNAGGLQQGIYTHIEVMGVGDVIKVYINGGLKDDTMKNTNRPPVSSLKVYTSDNWNVAADATLK